MIYPTQGDLKLGYFSNSRNTYDVTDEYPSSIIPIEGVFIKNFHFDFWKIVSPYLPKGSYISNAYVQPEMQAKIGLDLLSSKVTNVDLSQYKSIKTNPELIGKYGTHYLFEFDYESIKTTLSSKGILWAKPNCSVHQRGLALDITSSNIDDVYLIIKWFYDNNTNFCNLSGVFIKQDSNKLHIEFNESSIVNESVIGNTIILNNSISSAIENSLKGKEDRFYEILRNNGHVNLDETAVPKHILSTMPIKAKKQNTFLAKAINEILIDALGGTNGIISKVVHEELEYVLGLVNGTVGALKCLGVELDTTTNGRASRVIREAIESEAVKTSHYNLIKNKLKKFDSIYDDSTTFDGKYLAIQDNTNSRSNINTKEITNIKLSNRNLSDTIKDTKNTPNNSDISYENKRISSVDDVVLLGYDHYLEYVSTSVVSNNIFVLEVGGTTEEIITHNLHSPYVSVSFVDLNGVVSIGGYVVVDNDTVRVNFNSSFSGKVIIRKN